MRRHGARLRREAIRQKRHGAVIPGSRRARLDALAKRLARRGR